MVQTHDKQPRSGGKFAPKLTAEQRAEILESGDRREALAVRYGVSISTIHNIKGKGASTS